MRAQTLSLCLPYSGCDAKCPYCVSKMTWAPKSDEQKWVMNLPKVKHFAEKAQVTDLVITGKGEPTIYSDFIRERILEEFGNWPIVLQTNGKHLAGDPDYRLGCLANHRGGGIDVLAVSIDDPDIIRDYSGLWEHCILFGVIPRITVMLTPKTVLLPFKEWIDLCKRYGILQVSFREVSIPTDRVKNKDSDEAAKWIQENIGDEAHYMRRNPEIVNWVTEFNARTRSCSKYREIRRLPYGAVIKDVEGVAVTLFNYCVQDDNGDEDIRSLIYNQDGHLYTTWNSPASAIF